MSDRFMSFVIKHPVVFGFMLGTAIMGINYLLALVGEPRALWFYRDILGVAF